MEESDVVAAPATVSESGDLQDFIDRAMAPHLVKKVTASEKQKEAESRQAATVALRAILHEPAFQALEAAWRGLFFLTQRLNTDVHLKVYVLDASRAEIAETARSASLPLALSYKKWAIIAGIYRFGRTTADVRLLDSLGQVAHALGAAFVAESGVPGERTEDREAWAHLRQSAHARNIGMVLPRFLLRHPYGKNGEAIESFPFEEMEAEPAHEDYLWGNPAFACTLLLGQAFEQQGWDMHSGLVLNIDRLPLHVYRSEGESVMKPCAEVWMGEKDAEFLLEEGIMPLASLKHSDSVRLARFQSIAAPAARLAGAWER
jgi:type VI secretion system protein ImpC